jgi:hypothetical protein
VFVKAAEVTTRHPEHASPSSQELFGGPVPASVRALIDAAREAPRASTSAILWTAQALEPSCLAIYYLLYKSHAARGELDDAWRAARLALRASGRQSGLPEEPEQAPQVVPPSGTDFSQPGAARFWLFTLKALAFIAVRRGQVETARRLLDVIAHVDPSHSVGSEVTAALVAAAE